MAEPSPEVLECNLIGATGIFVQLLLGLFVFSSLIGTPYFLTQSRGSERSPCANGRFLPWISPNKVLGAPKSTSSISSSLFSRAAWSTPINVPGMWPQSLSMSLLESSSTSFSSRLLIYLSSRQALRYL